MMRYPFTEEDTVLPPVNSLGTLGIVIHNYLEMLHTNNNSIDIENMNINKLLKSASDEWVSETVPSSVNQLESISCKNLAKIFMRITGKITDFPNEFKIYGQEVLLYSDDGKTARYSRPIQENNTHDFLFALSEYGLDGVNVPLRSFLQACFHYEHNIEKCISNEQIIALLCSYYSSFDPKFQSIFAPDLQCKYESFSLARRFNMSSFLHCFSSRNALNMISLNAIWLGLHSDDDTSLWVDYLYSNQDAFLNYNVSDYSLNVVSCEPFVPSCNSDETMWLDTVITNFDSLLCQNLYNNKLTIGNDVGLLTLSCINFSTPSPVNMKTLIVALLDCILEDNKLSEEMRYAWELQKKLFLIFSYNIEHIFNESVSTHIINADGEAFHHNVLIKSKQFQSLLIELLNRYDQNLYSFVFANVLSQVDSMFFSALKEDKIVFPKQCTIEESSHDYYLFGRHNVDIINLAISLSGYEYSRRHEKNSYNKMNIITINPKNLISAIWENDSSFKCFYDKKINNSQSKMAQYATQTKDVEIQKEFNIHNMLDDGFNSLTNKSAKLNLSMNKFDFLHILCILWSENNFNGITKINELLYSLNVEEIINSCKESFLKNEKILEYTNIPGTPFSNGYVSLRRIVRAISFWQEKNNEDNLESFSLLFAAMFVTISLKANSTLIANGKVLNIFSEWGIYAGYLNYSDQYLKVPKHEKEKMINRIQQKKIQNETWNPVAPNNIPFISEFCTDLTEKALTEGIGKNIVAREDVMHYIITILTRRSKANPLLLGDAGTGKTAIVESLAQMIIKKEAPENLQNIRICQLILSKMIDKTVPTSIIEERIRKIIEEAIATKTILFIDEIHMISDTGGREFNFANVLKPYLAREGLSVIGATTYREYNSDILPDKALVRRFSPVAIPVLTFEEVIMVLSARKQEYETFHSVNYDKETLLLIARMAEDYISNRKSPDRELDIMDLSGTLATMKKNKKVTEEDVYEAIRSLSSNKSVTFKKSSDAFDPKKIIEDLKNVAGQREAKKIIAERIAVSNAGLHSLLAPKNVFLFCGPSGVGKTLMAKELASVLNVTQDDVITLSMNEFSKEHETSRLIGSPPGYIGSKEGGTLTNFAMAHSSGIVILDEIEKANPKIQEMFLNVFDSGFIDAATGEHVDCRALTFVCTTNVNIDNKKSPMGFATHKKTEYSEDITTLKSTLIENLGAPLIGRIDSIVLFKELTNEDLLEICAINRRNLQKDFERRFNIDINSIMSDSDFDEAVKNELTNSDHSAIGARGIWKTIEHDLKIKVLDTLG